MRSHISMETAKDQDVGLNCGIVEVIKSEQVSYLPCQLSWYRSILQPVPDH